MSPNGIEIFVMNADGSNRTQLTNNSVTDGFPRWSPDGAKIIFASGDVADETSVELFVMNADGSNRTRLTNNSVLDWFADWQPSSGRISGPGEGYKRYGDQWRNCDLGRFRGRGLPQLITVATFLSRVSPRSATT